MIFRRTRAFTILDDPTPHFPPQEGSQAQRAEQPF